MKALIPGALLVLLAASPFAASAEETHTVTIAAYIDGEHANASETSADGDALPMISYWRSTNPPSGNGTYPLSSSGFNTSTPYEAVTSPMSHGGKYQTRTDVSWTKVDDGTLVSGNCRTGKKYTLEGYSVGDSLAEAESDGPSDMSWAGTNNLTSDQYIIVWYRHCLEQPTHLSPKNGASRTSAQQTSIDWSDVDSDYGDVSYYYESATDKTLAADGSFVNPVYESGALSSSEIPTPGTPPATYYWHVRAVDTAGNESWWSNPWKVIVKSEPAST